MVRQEKLNPIGARRNCLKFPPPDTSYSRGRKRGRRKGMGGKERIAALPIRNALYIEGREKIKRGWAKVSFVAG